MLKVDNKKAVHELAKATYKANRKRNIQIKIWVTDGERKLIEHKMSHVPTRQIGAYLRKMAIDGYIIYVDTKGMNIGARYIT